MTTFIEKSTTSDLSTFSDLSTISGTDDLRLSLDFTNGTATNKTVSLAKGASNNEYFISSSSFPNKLAWGTGGVYTLNVNVTTAAGKTGTQITKVEFIRISSSGTILARISNTALTISLTTTGVKTTSITDSSGTLNQPSGSAQTDRFVCVFQAKNGSSNATDSFVFETQVSANSDTVVAPMAVVYNVSPSDTLSISDSISATAKRVKSISETLTPSDSISANKLLSKSISDSISPSDSISNFIVRSEHISDSLSPTDQITDYIIRTISLSDTLSPTDQITNHLIIAKSVSDTLSPTDSISKTVNRTITLSDNLTPTDSLGDPIIRQVAISDTITPNDSLSASVTSSDPPGHVGGAGPSGRPRFMSGISKISIIRKFGARFVLLEPKSTQINTNLGITKPIYISANLDIRLPEKRKISTKLGFSMTDQISNTNKIQFDITKPIEFRARTKIELTRQSQSYFNAKLGLSVKKKIFNILGFVDEDFKDISDL